MTQPTWNDERVERMKALWTEGFSASQIARQLGNGITRNAVIAKIDRLRQKGAFGGAPPRTVQQRQPRVTAIPKVPEFKSIPVVETVIEEPPPILDDGTHVTMLTVSDKTCRWPIGDPQEESFHFCGRRPALGRAYCESHARKAYQKMTPYTRPHQAPKRVW